MLLKYDFYILFNNFGWYFLKNKIVVICIWYIIFDSSCDCDK